ncbi:hypothetical protein RRG08_041451, partial [Elysia crispata]
PVWCGAVQYLQAYRTPELSEKPRRPTELLSSGKAPGGAVWCGAFVSNEGASEALSQSRQSSAGAVWCRRVRYTGLQGTLEALRETPEVRWKFLTNGKRSLKPSNQSSQSSAGAVWCCVV